MQKKTRFMIGFWLVFIVLFIIGHIILSNIIMYYQQRPAIETAEAYDVMSQYKQSVLAFYNDKGYCPTMVEKEQISGAPKAYRYVESLRLLRDDSTKTCFISAVMREDTPSPSVKGKTLVIVYNSSMAKPWACYTDINDKYVINACLDHPLPMAFKQALASYLSNLQRN